MPLLLVYFVNIALGLIAVYWTLVNAVAHLVTTVVLRCYNPGLITALVKCSSDRNVEALAKFLETGRGGGLADGQRAAPSTFGTGYH